MMPKIRNKGLVGTMRQGKATRSHAYRRYDESTPPYARLGLTPVLKMPAIRISRSLKDFDYKV